MTLCFVYSNPNFTTKYSTIAEFQWRLIRNIFIQNRTRFRSWLWTMGSICMEFENIETVLTYLYWYNAFLRSFKPRTCKRERENLFEPMPLLNKNILAWLRTPLKATSLSGSLLLNVNESLHPYLQVFNETRLFTFGQWTHGYDVNVELT